MTGMGVPSITPTKFVEIPNDAQTHQLPPEDSHFEEHEHWVLETWQWQHKYQELFNQQKTSPVRRDPQEFYTYC